MYKKHTLNIPLADSCHFFLYHSTCEIKIETPLKKKKKRRLKDGRQDNARTVGRERKTTGGRNCFLPLKKQLLRFFFSFFFFFFFDATAPTACLWEKRICLNRKSTKSNTDYSQTGVPSLRLDQRAMEHFPESVG